MAKKTVKCRGDEGDACDWENPVYAHNNNESFYA